MLLNFKKTDIIKVAAVSLLMIFISCNYSENGQSEQLVWSDEFDSNQPDTSKWEIIVGNGCPHFCGFGNKELQYYTDLAKNIRIENSRLIIEAHQDSIESNAYTSAKIVSKNKGDWKYGRIEIKAKLPTGRGTWPAIWMLPTLNRDMQWPADGEIDIMEHVGYNQNWIVASIHTGKYNHVKRTHKSDSTFVENASEEFNVYAIDWTEEKIDWYVNDLLYHTVNKNGDEKEGWPFYEPFHLIINLAVGGNWGGKHGVDDAIWPQTLEIDYVRVFQ